MITPFRDASDKLWSAKEWYDFKFDAFRSLASLDPTMQILTGMLERDDIHIGYVDKSAAATAIAV